jgi:hypothetical protein
MWKPISEKHCPECNRRFSVDEVVCVKCETIFEERTYLSWIGITSVIALGLVWWMQRQGLLATFSLVEALKYEAALLLSMYPTAKLVQKIRDPRRPVLREMGSVFSSRSDRAMILMLMLVYPAAFSGLFPRWLPSSPQNAFHLGIIGFVSIAGAIACLAIVFDQKLAFFDFRIRNTYVERYR